MTTTEPETTELTWLMPEQIAQHPDNVRDATRGIKALAASIKEVGVLVPLIVVPVEKFEAGEFPPGITHVAVDGNRRQAAAALLAEEITVPMPCMVRPDLDTALKDTRTMMVTGLARDGLTAKETALAVQSMLSLGMTQAATARAVGWKPAQVKQARSAAKAVPLSDGYDLTLDQLAAVAEFEDNEPLRDRLLQATGNGDGYFEHELARVRRELARDQMFSTAVTEWTASGYALLDERPSYRPVADSPLRLSALRGAEGQMQTDEHEGCEHRAVWLGIDYSDSLSAVEACTDWSAHTLLHPDDGPVKPATAEALEVAEAEAKARKTEERREVITNNRAMEAATDVRVDFIRRIQKSAKDAKAMAEWALARVVGKDPVYTQWVGSYHDRAPAVEDNPNLNNRMRLWGQVCSAYEAGWAKDCWREAGRAAQQRKVYLDHLTSLGYVLADVELIVLAEADKAKTRGYGSFRDETVVNLPDEDTTEYEDLPDPGLGDEEADEELGEGDE